MILVQRIFRRPNESVAFYEPTQEYKDRYKTAYKDTGKLVSGSRSISPNDPLVQLNSAVWADDAALEEYRTDPVCQAHFAARNAYNDANGIESNKAEASMD